METIKKSSTSVKQENFTVGLVQMHSENDKKLNLKKAEKSIEELASKGSQIICLQELFSSNYFCSAYDLKNFDLAEEFPNEDIDHFAKLAKKLNVVIIYPFYEKRQVGIYQNSVCVLDADGKNLGVYRKMHIPDDPLFYEKYYFTPGDIQSQNEPGFRIFETKFAKIGVLICWDQWFPEAARILSLKGAEVLFYPTAIGWHPQEKAAWGDAQVSAWQTMQRSHAIANGVYVASPNRVGFEPTPQTDGLEFFGHSFICDPFGRVVAQAGEGEENISATCSRKLQEDVRRSWPFLRDRRIDSYQEILNRSLEK